MRERASRPRQQAPRNSLAVAYEYLQQVNRISSKINRRMLQAEALRSCLLPKAITIKDIKVQESPPQDKMADTLVRVQMIEEELGLLAAEKEWLIIDICSHIERLGNDREREVLTAHYIGGQSITSIADRMNYSTQGIYTIRRRGVKNLAKIL